MQPYNRAARPFVMVGGSVDQGQFHIGGKRQVGPLLTRLREGSGKTSREVAHESGVPQSSLAQWETGHHCPNVSSLSKILRYYGVTATIGVQP